MPYPSQKILVFVCILLCACAAGMSEETDPAELVAVPEANPALVVDAAQPFVPSVVSSTPDSALTSTPAAPMSPQSQAPTPTSPANTSVPSTTAVDAATADGAVADASTASSDAGAPTPSGDSGASDAGTSASSDASTAPVSAPMCVVEQCTNNCLLLPRCCNEQNQCACYSVLRRSCSLSSL